TVEIAHETNVGQRKEEDDFKLKVLNNESKFSKVLTIKELENEDISNPKHNSQIYSSKFKNNIPEIVKEFQENYDFLILYDEWRQKQLSLKCFSIMDSLVIHPNGD